MIRDNAIFVYEELERNYVSAQMGLAEQRRATICQMQGVATSHGELVLLKLASLGPTQTRAVLGIDSELEAAYPYLGAGSQHTSIMKNNSVTKINRKSVLRMTESERIRSAETANNQHATLRRYLGDYALQQATQVGAHPLKPLKRAVLTEQEYVNFEDLGLFSAYTPKPHTEVLPKLENRYPNILDALGEFAKRSIKLYNERGLLVDCSGPGNVVMVTSGNNTELQCIDGSPIEAVHQQDTDRIIGQLTSLQEALT